MIPNPVERYECLRSFGVIPNTITPLSALYTAERVATAAGELDDFRACLFPDELALMEEWRDRPNANRIWRVVGGLTALQYAVAIFASCQVDTPPEPAINRYHVIAPREMRTNPLRIRGGAVQRAERPLLLLPAPKIAGLLTAGMPNTAQPANDYWRAIDALQSARTMERER
jgi:hypothetical protein